MGHGIALTMARAGHQICVQDTFPDSLASLHERIKVSMQGMGVDAAESDQTLLRIRSTENLADALADADLVFEAAPEKLELKQALFEQIEKHVSKSCILASNTSVMPITNIMQKVKHKQRALGTHWWNPPHLIPLVEVVSTQKTDSDCVDHMVQLLNDVGKTAIRVNKDIPGFIGNRLQHALWREAISLVENGVCDAKSVDAVVKASFGKRLAVLGPLENADLVGTDLTLDIHSRVLFDLESRQGPSPYLEQLVSEGKLGMKSGTGFRDWSQDEANELRARVIQHLNKLETIL